MAETKPVKVWDLLLRLTHWSFVGLIFALWYTAENSIWGWHTRLGTALFGLVIFRIIWGFVGPETARFSQFVKGPREVWAYLKGDYTKDAHIGHNPLGAYAVLALLGVMLAQTTMGLFAGDPYDGATGPLNGLVGVLTADMLTDWHEAFFWVVVGMIALHIIAIGVYGVIQLDDLISPMITGKREAPLEVSGIAGVPWGRGLIALLLAAGLAFWIWSGAPPLG